MSHRLFETDQATLAALVAQLREIAHAARRRLPVGQTLATTALVNEAYLKLAKPNSAGAIDQRHFFALAARAMRELLVDEARRKSLQRTNAQAPSTSDANVNTDPEILWLTPGLDSDRLVALDQALGSLTQIHPRLAEVVMCRFFAGYTEVETADILGVDTRTVQRDWQRARAWLAELTA
jgi:RNA polymerase sigma factor (TIGR02999 family)